MSKHNSGLDIYYMRHESNNLFECPVSHTLVLTQDGKTVKIFIHANRTYQITGDGMTITSNWCEGAILDDLRAVIEAVLNGN